MSARPHTPKIPLSPSSPPETGLKRRRTSETKSKLPPSPPHMSVATKSYVSYGQASHLDEAASRSSPRSPSSASSYARTSTQRNSQPYSTPNSTHSAAPGANMNDDSDQHRDKRQRRDDDRQDEMEVDHSILPTNHDRLKEESEESKIGDSVPVQEQKTTAVLEQLDQDMGEPFLLSRSRVFPTKPDPQKHMLSMYGLGPLLRTVARFDPDTGEKINRLRKSYEGQIKGFQLSGRNKPVKHEPEKGPGFRASIGSGQWPATLDSDEDWNGKHATRRIEVDDGFRAKLRQAMQMQPGTVRDVQKWDDVLGHEKTRPLPAAAAAAAAHPPSNFQQRPNGHFRPPPNAADAKRQTRGKKRSYTDLAFVGYGDGFSDADDHVDPDADDDGDDSTPKKRRKNDSFSSAQGIGR